MSVMFNEQYFQFVEKTCIADNDFLKPTTCAPSSHNVDLIIFIAIVGVLNFFMSTVGAGFVA